MPKSYKGLTTKEIDSRLKQGRGQGTGSSYLPFITVRDISSKGRSHRVFSAKTGRVHHLLSDLELAIFLVLEWLSCVVDIREQFPLSIDETTVLADEARIKHSEWRGVYQMMTTDFLVDMNTPDCPRWALSAKYAKDLDDARTIEKQELERRFWKQKQTPWYLVTEREIPEPVFNNVQWLYPAQSSSVDEKNLEHYFHLFEEAFHQMPDRRIIVVAQQLDSSNQLTPGESLHWLRHLMAQRHFVFDITKPYLKLTAAELSGVNHQRLVEAYHAAG